MFENSYMALANRVLLKRFSMNGNGGVSEEKSANFIICHSFFVIMMLNRGQDGVDNKMLYEFQQTLDRKIDRNSSYQFISGEFARISKSGRLGRFYSCLRNYRLKKRVSGHIDVIKEFGPKDIVMKNITMRIDEKIELKLKLSNAVVTGFVFGVNGDFSYFASYCELKLLNTQ
ncbi:hypothetical protein [Vibrio mangrovi]|uniref:Uncharacterized protein n=1 Tax=Vibrio mangrovi TaxID=474394 RepID=A0A1Y6IUY8_9VIBR|nr:hypothetical protein [Vibrio mangrovi]MDW6002144.1 hypothetical protein [Vibrio mangrovi]SMS01489.1 hypothetical protein VIM7927_02785 [Vibrio mangrovi]